ncbi:MAG: glycerol-3-phosphate acyltransferase, partial [Acidimicrobiales bacterium]
MLLSVLVVIAAYLAGTFPTALIVGRRLGFDATTAGSGNPGASNAYRVGGRRAGLLVFAGDLLKGALAAGLGLAVGGRALG